MIVIVHLVVYDDWIKFLFQYLFVFGKTEKGGMIVFTIGVKRGAEKKKW